MYIDEFSTRTKKHEILLKSDSRKARDGKGPSHAIVSLKGPKQEILGFGFFVSTNGLVSVKLEFWKKLN